MNQAQRLKELRKKSELSLRELSEKTGISKSALSDLELDKRKGTIEILTTLAKFYKVSLDYLVGTDSPIHLIDDMVKVLIDNKIIIPGEKISPEAQSMIINMIEHSLTTQRNQP